MIPQINITKNVCACLLVGLFGLTAGLSAAQAQDEPFITIWASDTTGASDDDQITIPGEGEDYDIAWTEVEEINGEWQEVTGGNSGNDTGTDEHTVDLGEPGTYRVEISGDFTRIHFEGEGDKRKILDVDQWGDIEWATMEQAFQGAANIDVSADDAPDLSEVTVISSMFWDAKTMNGSIGHWDTGNITDMRAMFAGADSFNQDIGDWDTGNVTDMFAMFSGANSFNQYIGEWETGQVTNMSQMFNSTDSFNQDISGWNTENVENMSHMFFNTDSFN